MKKITEITEFQSIVCEDSRYEKQEQYKYLPQKTFRELETFIKEYTFAEDETEESAADYFKIGFKKHVGDIISAKNYVGLIELKSGHQIQVLPKMDLGDSGTDTKAVFLKMLCAMKDFPAKVFKNAGQKAGKMNLYEIFIQMYIQEVRELVKHGLRSSYLATEDNLHYYKGKLIVGQQIKHNLTHAERFYVAFDEFQRNRPENKLIKSTLLKLLKITGNADNSKEINQLLTAFELVDPSTNYEKDFSRVVIDRNTKDYENLMRWSKVFLMNKSFTTFSGENNARALLFPMDRVFEAYVAQQLHKYAPRSWKVSAQDKGYYLFDSPKGIFKIRPDIVIRNGDKCIVLDTKWKRLIPSERDKYGISQSDMYQMYAYSKKYHTPEVWVLFPYTEEMKDYTDLHFRSLDGDELKTTIHIYFVDLKNIEASLKALLVRLEESYDRMDYPV